MIENQAQKVNKPWYKTPWGILILLILLPFSLSYWIWKQNGNLWLKLALIGSIWIIVTMIGYAKDPTRKPSFSSGEAINVIPIPTSLEQATVAPTETIVLKPTEMSDYVPLISPTPTPEYTQTPTIETKTDRSKMIEVFKTNAMAKWGEDYEMVNYTVENQTQAYDWIVNQTKYPDIMERAKQKWGGDYEMVKYEYENQVKAYKAL